MNTNILNLILAFSALPPIVVITYHFLHIKLNGSLTTTKRLLIALFVGIAITAGVNVLYYIFREFDLINSAPFASIRSYVVNGMLSAISWLFFFVIRSMRKKI